MASIFKRGGKENRDGYYYVSWFDHAGKRRSKCARTTDKATAERIGAKLDTEAAKRREGLIDPQLEQFACEARRPLAELIVEYKAKLVANLRTERYIAEAVGYVERIAKAESIATAAEFTAERVAHYAADLRRKGKGARTVQAPVGAAKSFTRWLAECEKLSRDPLTSVKKPSLESDRRHERRMLLPEEWPCLQAAAAAGPIRYGMDGAERALLYRTAIASGLRANELRSLTRTSIVVDAARPFIRVKAADTKNGKSAQQFIDRELAAALGAHLKRKTPAAAVFDLPHSSNLARMLRDDLDAARAAWLAEVKDDAEERTRREQAYFLVSVNEAGERLDFHSLRHTCGGWLASTGAHAKTVQAVMRHSTITLTMDTYGHLLPGAEAEAADRLGAMVSLRSADDDDQEITLKMTGTDPQSAQRQKQQLGRVSGRERATARDGCGACGNHHPAGPKSIGPRNVGQSAPLEHSVQLGTMVASPNAPLAQLAEQLTLNQSATPINAEEFGHSLGSAAPEAAVSAETGGEQADAAGGKAANQAASMTGYDPDLSEVANRWATLPDAVRLAVMALVRSASR